MIVDTEIVDTASGAQDWDKGGILSEERRDFADSMTLIPGSRIITGGLTLPNSSG